MTALAAAVALPLHAALMFGGALLLAGLMAQAQARLLGSAGPPVLAPFHALGRLLAKAPAVPERTTAVFRAAPPLAVGASAAAALLVPSFTLNMATAQLADLLTLLGLLALARIAAAMAALDAGGAVGGAAAAQCVGRLALAAPAAIGAAACLALLTGTGNLDRAIAVLNGLPAAPRLPAAVALGLTVAALCLLGLVLNGRRPAAAPGLRDTLAMGPEAMLLEASGADLGWLRTAGQIQLLVWLTLIGDLALPWPGLSASVGADAGSPLLAWLVGLLAWIGRTLLLAAALLIVEHGSVRLVAARVPALLGAATVLVSLGALLLLAVQRGA